MFLHELDCPGKYRHFRPMVSRISGFLLCVLSFSACSRDAQKVDAPADALSSAIGRASSVSIYMISRTEQYDYDVGRLRSEASVVMVRRCGGDCAHLFAPIVKHLRDAVEVRCSKGQQDVLIEAGMVQLIYSHSGRSIEFSGRCYFNGRSVKDVIKSIDLIYG
jgi:hypothetical protein